MVPEISNDSKREVRDMSQTLQRANKRSSWKIARDLPTSFLYAAQGLKYAFSTQRNFRIHVVFGLGVYWTLPVWGRHNQFSKIKHCSDPWLHGA